MTCAADTGIAGVVVVVRRIEEAFVADDAVSFAGYEEDGGVARSNCVFVGESEAVCS